MKKASSVPLLFIFAATVSFAQTQKVVSPTSTSVKKVSVEGRESTQQIIKKEGVVTKKEITSAEDLYNTSEATSVTQEVPAASELPTNPEAAPVQRTTEEPAVNTSTPEKQTEPSVANKEVETESTAAQDKELDEEKKTTQSKPKKRVARPEPKRVTVLAEAAPITIWSPKVGGAASVYIFKDLALEFNGMFGKFDPSDFGVDAVSEVKEQRMDFLLRYYTGRVFSIFAGYSMQETKITVSDKVKIDNINLPFDNTQVDANGVMFGISSRWHWRSGFTLGVDWLSVFMPLTTDTTNDLRKEIAKFTDPKDFKDVEDAYKRIEETPRVSLLEFSLGWTF